MRNRGRIKRKEDILTERDNLTKEQAEKFCHLSPVEITCKDCDKKFWWYEGTLRCSKCTIQNKNNYYEKNPDAFRLVDMVLTNAKAQVIFKFSRGAVLKEWLLSNTKLKEHKIRNSSQIIYRLDEALKKGYNGFKYICYWVMKEDDYTKDEAIKLINRRSKILGVKKDTAYTPEKIEQVLAIFKEEGLGKDIAEKYKVSRSIVNHIKSGRIYGKITGKEYQRRYKK